MNKLFSFLWKYNYFFSFTVLFFLSFYLLIIYNQYQHTSFFTRYYQISGRYNAFKSNISGYLKLKDTNTMLLIENVYLRENNISSFILRQKGQIFINDSIYQQQYTYIPSYVVHRTYELNNNYIIIDQGSEHGIEPEMGVISSEGVVGIVQHTSAHYASVLLLNNLKTSISGYLKKTGNNGRILWDAKLKYNFLQMLDIPIDANVNIGDTVTTGNASLLYPMNTPIGIIHEVIREPGEDFLKIKMKTFVNFNKLNYVYVVNNLYKSEQTELTQLTKNTLKE